MLLSAALTAAIASASPPTAQAQANVRVAHAVRITSEAWRLERSLQRREITVVENGRRVTFRVIEFE